MSQSKKKSTSRKQDVESEKSRSKEVRAEGQDTEQDSQLQTDQPDKPVPSEPEQPQEQPQQDDEQTQDEPRKDERASPPSPEPQTASGLVSHRRDTMVRDQTAENEQIQAELEQARRVHDARTAGETVPA